MQLRPNQDLPRYLIDLAHEFIHVEMRERYNISNNYYFLSPEDFAFRNLVEETFAKAIDLWVYLSDPAIPNDRQIRNSHTVTAESYVIADAMRNDLRAAHPNYSEEQLNDMVAARMINTMMTSANAYSISNIPNAMATYGRSNTFLIPEYAAYRARGDMLLRHKWNHLASLMPFSLPADVNYDHYRGRFMNHVNWWATFAQRPEDSILYWINYDAAGAAQRRLAALPENDRRYNYLPRADEQRLNRIFQQLDPTFVPVNTLLSEQRMFQEVMEDFRRRQNQGR